MEAITESNQTWSESIKRVYGPTLDTTLAPKQPTIVPYPVAKSGGEGGVRPGG